MQVKVQGPLTLRPWLQGMMLRMRTTAIIKVMLVVDLFLMIAVTIITMITVVIVCFLFLSLSLSLSLVIAGVVLGLQDTSGWLRLVLP